MERLPLPVLVTLDISCAQDGYVHSVELKGEGDKLLEISGFARYYFSIHLAQFIPIFRSSVTD